MHSTFGSNRTNPAAPNRSAVAQSAHLRQALVAKLGECMAGFQGEFSNESEAFLHFVRLVVNEAAALAWSTPYPQLFLMTLVDEKIHYLRNWGSRQYRVSNGLDATFSATRWEAD